MGTTLESIELAAKQLSVSDRAALAHRLLHDLDEAEADEEYIESLWASEAENRIDAYLNAEIDSSPGSDVIERVKAGIRK